MESVLAAFVAALLSFTHPYAAAHGRVLTQRDTMCLAEAIYHEGRGEHVAGGSAVAFVALNRSALSGESLCQIIHTRHQFSFYNTRHPKPIHESAAWKFSVYLAVYTQLGLLPNPIGNATSYNTIPVRTWLGDNVVYRKVGHHYFYILREQINAPPLVPTHIVDQTPLPRLMFFDSDRENRVVAISHADSRAVLSDVAFPSQGDTKRMRDGKPSQEKEHAIVRLPPAIPFPEEPELSHAQVDDFVAALIPTTVRPLHMTCGVIRRPYHRSGHMFEHHHHKRRHRL